MGLSPGTRLAMNKYLIDLNYVTLSKLLNHFLICKIEKIIVTHLGQLRSLTFKNQLEIISLNEEDGKYQNKLPSCCMETSTFSGQLNIFFLCNKASFSFSSFLKNQHVYKYFYMYLFFPHIYRFHLFVHLN